MADIAAVDQLVYKGVHNSYDKARPYPPAEQLDLFGAWAIELDIGIPASESVFYVGHDGIGQGADGSGVYDVDGSYRLVDHLRAIQRTEALKYRPVLLYLEKKYTDWPFQNDYYRNTTEMLDLLGAELQSVFGQKVFGPQRAEAWVAAHGSLPKLNELAGEVIPIAIQPPPDTGLVISGSPLIFRDLQPPVQGAVPDKVLMVADGIGGSCCPPLFTSDLAAPLPFPPRVYTKTDTRVWRLDNFVSDWSYAYGIPPNPLVVNLESPAGTEVAGCGFELLVRETTVSSPQGTRLLPFRTVSEAVARARAEIPIEQGQTVAGGAGFTVLVGPGAYPAPLRIDIPLTLRLDAPVGVATIG